MTLYTVGLSCGCEIADAPYALPPKPGGPVYCLDHMQVVTANRVEAVPEPMPEYAENILDHCTNCGAPWSHHANLGTGDAAEPVCLCKHGGAWDDCRGSTCKAAL